VSSKTVEFKKIKVRNFLSYGDDPIEIQFQKGITFVTGYNKDNDSYNGVGKTSLIVESLSFLLFGETYRDINQSLIPNKYGGKTCIVEGWLKVNDDELHIVRSLSPKKLILSVNGDSDNFTKSIPETTKDIIDRIGISKTMFTNTIVMTNKDSMNFLNQKKEMKTKFIEGILGLEFFTEWNRLSKEEYKNIEDVKSKKYQELTIRQRDYENDKIYHDNFDAKKREEINTLQAKITNCQNVQPVDNSQKMIDLENKKTEILQIIQEKETKINAGIKKKLEIQAEQNQLKKNLSALSGTLLECPSCKRPFEQHNKQQIEDEKNDLKIKINDVQTKIDKLQLAINKVTNEVLDYRNSVRNIENDLKNMVVEKEKFIKSKLEIESLQQSLDKAKNQENPFSEKIKLIAEKIKECQNEFSSASEKSRLAEIVKEATSPTGIKSIMIKKIIDSLNNRINHYLIRLHSPFRVYFDEFFEEKFKSIDDQEYSYGSLSGGEQKRVDFAMLFSFRDIRRIQSGVNINITVMDELFDSALCGSGMQNIIDLLQENQDECYMIVTHRSHNVEAYNCRTIDLIKENKITRLNF
jgi:DNA repair exonuclease SbcCD ATPase subunit